jgi:predicted GH43/DUF377 family glycosyl hydrolase
MNSKGGIKFQLKTQKKEILIGMVAVVLSLLLVVGYTAPVLADTEPVLDIGNNGEWDDERVERACVIKDGATYKMWYSGYNGSKYKIGYATSSDGINWEKYAGNPVLDLGDIGDWDDDNIFHPWVIKDDNPTTIGHEYKMYYSGFDGSSWSLGYAYSSDGINWSKSGANPILTSSVSGWDDSHVRFACVIKNETDEFEMWYSGRDADDGKTRIGYATSSNGEHASWTKSGLGSVVDGGSGGAFDETEVQSPCVIKRAVDDYEMWYTGFGSSFPQIGYATSSDGTTWIKHNGDGGPVLTESSAGNFDANGVLAPCVIFESSYKMWYSGDEGEGTGIKRIGYAISDDGINWTRISVPEFQVGSIGFPAMLVLTMAVAVSFTMILVYKHKRK